MVNFEYVKASCSRLVTWLRQSGELDVRGLAAVRVSIGLLTLLLLRDCLVNFDAFFSGEGVYSELACQMPPSGLAFALPHWACGKIVPALALLVATLGSLALTFGYRPNRAAGIVLSCVIAVYLRNPAIVEASQRYLLFLLFWMMGLPLDRHFSIKNLLNRQVAPRASVGDDDVVSNAWSIGLIFQIACVYVFAAIEKTGSAWHSEHSAISMVVMTIGHLSPLGKWLGTFPNLLSFMTRAVWTLEMFGPILLFLPWRRAKPLFVLGFFAFHGGIMLTLNLVNFSLIFMAPLLALLPWRYLKSSGAHVRSAPTTVTNSNRKEIAGASGIALVFYLNAIYPTFGADSAFARPAEALRKSQFWQRWDMFAPGPYPYRMLMRVDVRSDGSGTQRSLGSGYLTSVDKPGHFQSDCVAIEPRAWTTYLIGLTLEARRRLRFSFLSYLCHQMQSGKCGTVPGRLKLIVDYEHYANVNRNFRKTLAIFDCPTPNRSEPLQNPDADQPAK